MVKLTKRYKNFRCLNIFKIRLNSRLPIIADVRSENRIRMFLLYFYGRVCIPLRYLILEYLQVLSKNWKLERKFSKIVIKEYFLFRLIVLQYIFYFESKVYYKNYLALIRLLYCKARVEANQNKIHIK